MSPRRSRLLAAAVLVGQLLLLAARTPDPSGTSSLLAAGALRLVAPVAHAVTATGAWFGSLGRAVRTRSQLAAENRRLRAELVELRRSQLRQSGLELEADELARALGFARASGLPLHAAEVVYVDPGSWLRTLLVRVGAAGARRDQVVLAERGVVGRVVEVSGPWAKVQLITDRAAALGVYLEKAHRQGMLRGVGAARLELDYIPRQIEVEPGDRVLTAGIDGVYPRGLPVGVVTEVEPGDEMFHRIVARPLVDFAELSTVFLLDAPAPPAPGAAGGADERRP
jgi:rod shape-determining protein MreC